MLHPAKSQSILHWFNSMNTDRAIQSLTQLSDGVHFYDIVAAIKQSAGKHADDLVNDSSSIVSTAEAVTDTQPVNDEKKAEANSSAIEMHVDEDVQERPTEPETNEEDSVSSSNKTSNEGEIQKRYHAIKKFIDDFFNLDSISLISYSECIKGKELELAKVAVLVLSAMVQSFLSSQNAQVYTTTLLEIQVQEDIKECLSLVLTETSVEDGPLKKTELQKILSRPSKSKGTPRRRTSSRGTPEVLDSPESSKSVPKKRRDRASVIAEEVYESPMKSLLESPKIQFKAAMFKKDSEIYKLKADLMAEEEKVIEMKLAKRSLIAELEKKKRELEFLKEEHKKFQNCADEADTSEKIKLEETLAEKERINKTINNLKEEMKILKKENENLHSEKAQLKEELSQRSNSEETDYKQQNGQLIEQVKELRLNISIKDDKIKDLKRNTALLEEDLKSYKQMHAEMSAANKSMPKTSPKGYENVGNIIYADERFDRDMLAKKQNECEDLRKQLATEIETSKKLRLLNKSIEKERFGLHQKARTLHVSLTNSQHDLEATRKMVEIYESWTKCMGKEDVLKKNGDKLATGNPPESLPSGTWTNTSDGSERERNVKEEPEPAKLWDTCSGKSMETRSRSASSLGNHRDSFVADRSISCSESEFLNLKKLARSIAKVLTKKYDAAETPHLTKLEGQAQCLSSGKDLCEFHQSVLEALRFVKPALPSISELPSKRKYRSQTVEEVDQNVFYLLDQNKTLETDMESLKQELSKLQKEFKMQLDAKTLEIRASEVRCQELQINIEELNDNLVESQQKVTDANKKYEHLKKFMEKVNQENNQLVEAFKLLKDEAVPKVDPCKECKLLRDALSDVKQEKRDFERDSAELRALVRDIESKNRNLERQLKNEMKERKKLEFKIQRESAFLSGSMSERNAVIHRYFQQGLAESKKAKIQAEDERKSHMDQPQQVVSFNTYILNHDNKDPYPENSMSTTFANRSIRSGFLQTDDEEDFLNHSSLAQMHCEVFPEPDPDDKRLTEIQRRNTLCLPHLQSSYPLELQNLTPTERKYFDNLRRPLHSFRMPLESTSEVTCPEFVGSDDSQDVQYPPLRKRKFSGKEKILMQPVKKIARSSSQVKQIQRVKPITPVRKTGFISKTKSFKTPTSIRRLMRMPQKNIKQ